ncbi:MAG: peptidase C1 [Bacteroidia bacterium]|nr:peptidase C1 [Bacteroidia bacterium]
MKKIASLIFCIVFLTIAVYAQKDQKKEQPRDKSVFKEFEPGYYQNSILKDIRSIDEKKEKKEKEKKFIMDQSGIDLPNKMDLYKKNTQWHNPSISQGNAGTCWAFSTTSFYESEIYRLTKKQVKLSELYTVYWEYVEKARRFIRERGNSAFGEGSEANAVARIFRQYGAMPLSAYSGLPKERKFHSHAAMFEEMNKYLQGLKTNFAWNEEQALETIHSIMNHYIGEPPKEFTYEGKNYTPRTFLKEYMQINPDDYVEILSYKQEPYWQQVEYKVTDNWWHSKDYYNIPLDDYMKVLKQAIRSGFTTSIGGDVSEAGLVRTTNCAMIPTFDIPSEYIDEDARQFRFSNGTTADDHGMHLVGYYEKEGKDWYLIKDSSSGSRNVDEKSPEFGYYFFHEDFVKLKMMNFTVHKDAVKEVLKKFGK